MRIVVTGCESSGTSLVSRILRSAGAEVCHRSATYDGDWPDLRKLVQECDATVVVFRDPFSTMASQADEGLSRFGVMCKLFSGYQNLFDALHSYPMPIFCITYEQLVLNPESIRPLLGFLDLDMDVEIEEVRNENAKYWALNA